MERYWKKELEGELPVLRLALDRPRSASPSYHGRTVHTLLSETLSSQLQSISHSQGNTLYVTLLAGFFWMLSKYSGQKDIIVGSPLAQRNQAENENLMGFFLNMLPIRQQLNPELSVAELLQATKEKVNGALEASDYPFTNILGWAQSARDTSISPVFQVMFNMLSYSDPALEHEGFSLDYESLETGHTKYDFSLYAQEYGDRLFLQIAYQTELFDDETMHRFLENLETFYSSMITNLDQTLSETPCIHPTEQRLLLELAKGPDMPIDHSNSLIELFEKQVERTPNSPALLHGEKELSYEALNSLTNQLTLKLIDAGATQDAPIAICLERSFHMVAAVLACMKVDCHFVFLDPQHPESRHRAILEEAQPRLLISDRANALTDALCKRILWNSYNLVDLDSPTQNLCAQSTRNDQFSIVYTSASTGRPKGVSITQDAILNRFQWMWESYPFSDGDVMLLQKSLGLVASSWECLGGLLKGVPTVIADLEEVVDPAALSQLCEKHGVTRIYGSPSLLKGVLEQREKHSQAYDSLRLAFTSAEPISPSQVRNWNEHFQNVPLYNLYGSTECSSNATEYCCRNLGDEDTRVPLGHPLPNISTFILDESLMLVPKGAVGELCIAGACLSSGYNGQDSETDAKFVSLKSEAIGHHLIYRTGDLARIRPDNQLEFLGRNDFQIKIRGFRIEPGEIENTLNSMPDIEESVIIVENDAHENGRLLAFITGKNDVDDREVRKSLRSKLPDYMIPSELIFLEKLPRTSSGKVDRRSLHSLVGRKVDSITVESTDALSLESLLIRLWRQLLGRSDIKVTDNFFDLGGHSLLATQLFAKIEALTGNVFPVSALYQAPSVRGLVQLLEDGESKPFWSSLIPIKATGTKPPLFCATPWKGSTIYFRYLPKYLKADQPVYGLENERNQQKGNTIDTLDDLIEKYFLDIQAFYPTGPLNICGFSGGGVVAWELASRFTEIGREVGKIILFDTSVPGHKQNLEQGKSRQELIKIKLSAHWEAIRHQKGFAKFQHLYQTILMKLQCHFFKPDEEEAETIRLEQEEMQIRREHFRVYSPTQYDGDIVLFTAVQRRMETIIDPSMGWESYAKKGVEICEVQGRHNTLLLEPNVKTLCVELQKRLDS